MVADAPNEDHDDDRDDPNDDRAANPGWALDPAVAKSLCRSAAESLAPMFASMAGSLRVQLATSPMIKQLVADWSESILAIDWGRLLRAFELSPELLETLELARELIPPNWPADIDVARMHEALVADGIPLVYAPRADTVADVLAAPDRSGRVAVLLAHRADVLQDCREVLAAVTSPRYGGKADLARQAVDTYASGHHAAAQGLAVVVVESVIRTVIHRDYTTAQRRVHVDDLEVMWPGNLRLLAALAPLHRFLTPWEKGKTPGPMPTQLSRHVTVHAGAPEHFDAANGLVAVLLAATVLRAFQELDEIRTRRGDPTWLPS